MFYHVSGASKAYRGGYFGVENVRPRASTSGKILCEGTENQLQDCPQDLIDGACSNRNTGGVQCVYNNGMRLLLKYMLQIRDMCPCLYF